MVVNIVQIGNSKGVRIPKAILQQCNIESEVTLEVEDGKIVLEPISRIPRKGWERALRTMHDYGDDKLLIDDALDVDTDDWEW